MSDEEMDPVTAKMYMFARKLRAMGEWGYADHYYTTDSEREANSAKRELAGDLAGLLDEVFEFDSNLTFKDTQNRRLGEGFKP